MRHNYPIKQAWVVLRKRGNFSSKARFLQATAPCPHFFHPPFSVSTPQLHLLPPPTHRDRRWSSHSVPTLIIYCIIHDYGNTFCTHQSSPRILCVSSTHWCFCLLTHQWFFIFLTHEDELWAEFENITKLSYNFSTSPLFWIKLHTIDLDLCLELVR